MAAPRPASHRDGITLAGYRRLVETHRLIQSLEYPNCDKLAQRFEVSRRTAERDIERLRDQLGQPLEYDPKKRGYYYTGPADLPLLKFQEGEAIAIFLGQRLLTQCKGTPFERFVADAMKKIRIMLPTNIDIKLDDVLDTVSFHSDPLRGEEAEIADRYQLIHGAIQRQRTISTSYFTAATGAVTLRTIDPYHLHGAHGAWYCIGYCHLRQEIRTFALDRMADLRETGAVFEIPSDFSIDEYLADSLELERGEPRRIVIEFDKGQVPYVKGKAWHKSQVLEELPDGSLRMTLMVGSIGEIKRWVMSLGSQAWLVEPQELRDEIRSELERARGRYRPSGSRASRV